MTDSFVRWSLCFVDCVSVEIKLEEKVVSRSRRFYGQHVRRGKGGYDADEGMTEQMYEMNEEMCRVERERQNAGTK
jgi:hypothetical protein